MYINKPPTREDLSVISPVQRPLPNTQNSQDIHISDPGVIQTHNPTKRAAADPCVEH